jgi:hypothetical protein
MNMNIYVEKIACVAKKNKYTRWYLQIVEKSVDRAKTRKHAKSLLGYIEGHHILPKCFKMGGETDRENIVFLTAREHFIAHHLLTKMFEENRLHAKTISALGGMTRTTSKTRLLTSRQVETARAACIARNKEMFGGIRRTLPGKPKVEDTDLKRCIQCKEIKSLDFFSKNKNMYDGLHQLCRSCFMIKGREYRTLHQEELKQYRKELLERDPNYKKKYFPQQADYKRLHRKNNPELAKAEAYKDNLKRWCKKNGMAYADYQKMFEAQGGTCRLCQRPSRYRLLPHAEELFCRECIKERRTGRH